MLLLSVIECVGPLCVVSPATGKKQEVPAMLLWHLHVLFTAELIHTVKS